MSSKISNEEKPLLGGDAKQSSQDEFILTPTNVVSAPSMTPSQRLRIDSAAILLGDAHNDLWTERPRMIEQPETYYLFMIHRFTRGLPSLSSWVLLLATILAKPGWCKERSLAH